VLQGQALLRGVWTLKMAMLRASLIVCAIGSGGVSTAAAEDCTTTETPLGRAICSIEIVRKTYGEVRAEYIAALGRLSPEGKSFLNLDQDAWEARTKAECIDHPEIAQSHHDDNYDMTVIPDEFSASGAAPVPFCLFERFRGRKFVLAYQPAHNGEFVWQTVNASWDQYCDGDPKAADNRLSFERFATRIEAPANDATRRWNARHGPEVSWPDDPQQDACAHDGQVRHGRSIVFAQGDLIMLLRGDLIVYYDKSHDYIWGHPTYGRQTERISLELVSTGRNLGATDFFVTGSGWEAFIGKRAYAEYLTSVKEVGGQPSRTEADYVASAENIDYWRIDAKTFSYEFFATNLNGFGSSTRFTWKELRPYLQDDLPFRPDFN
jgi:hypothetical protein